MNLRRLAREERVELAELLATLSPEQWEASSLCEGWRVRDVVAHVVSYDGLSAHALVDRFVRGRLLPDRINAVAMADYRRRSPEELLALLREHLDPHGFPAALGGQIALVDGLIHQQDIRRPLGIPREIPAERLRPALHGALTAPVIRGFWRVRGLRLVADDLDWSAGRGPEVRGTAEALLMAIAGRPVLSELSGPGQQLLSRRLRASSATT
jgi:uncharacterized protein (TIGR03083 family)